MNDSIGMYGLIQMLVHLVLIIVAWRSLRHVKIENIFQIPSPIEARIIRLFLSIILGHGVGQFFFDYLSWTSMLNYIGQSS